MALPAPSWWVQTIELFSGRTGDNFLADMERRYVKKFKVIANTNLTDPSLVCGQNYDIINGYTQVPLIPLPFSPYIDFEGNTNDLNAIVVAIKPEQEFQDDWQTWIVTVEYSTKLPTGGPAIATDNPGGLGAILADVGEVPIIGAPSDPQAFQNQPWGFYPSKKWDSESEHVAEPTDLDGKPRLNSANQPFSPAPTVLRFYPVLHYTRNMLSYDQTLAGEIAMSVNSVTFLGYPAGTAQLYPVVAEEMWLGGLAYWRVSFRWRFRSDVDANGNRITWQPRVLDCGFCYLGPDGRPIQIRPYNLPLSTPSLLDGEGQELPANLVTPAGITYLTFRDYPSYDHNQLLISGLN